MNRNIVPLLADVTREEDSRKCHGRGADALRPAGCAVNNAGRGMKYVSESFMTEPTQFWEVEARDLGPTHGEAQEDRDIPPDGLNEFILD